MKKTNKLFFTMCMAGTFALLFASCKKNDDTVTEVSINLPVVEEEADGRAYIDYANGNRFFWHNGDEVAIYNLAKDGVSSQKAIFVNRGADSQATTIFNYESGDPITSKKDAGYFMFYPAAKVSDAPLAEGNYETFTVSPNQDYTFAPDGNPTMDPAGMALAIDFARMGTGSITLKHIFGALRLRLKGTAKVTKIEVVDNRYALSGNLSMKLHEVKMSTFSILQNSFIATDDPDNEVAFYGAWNQYKETLGYNSNGGGFVMALNCAQPVQLNDREETQFMIGLRPGALKYGFTLKIYVEGQNEPLEYVNAGQADWHYGIKAGVNKNVTIEGIN